MSNIDIIPIFPLPAAVLPGELFPIHIFEDRFRQLISHCRGKNEAGSPQPFGVSFSSSSDLNGIDGLSKIGCLVEIADVLHEFEDGRSVVLTTGEARYRLLNLYEDGLFPMGRVEYCQDIEEEVQEDLRAETIELFTKTLDIGGYEARFGPESFGNIAFHLAAAIQLDPAERQELLGELSENRRLERLNDFLRFRLLTLQRASDPSGELLFRQKEKSLH